MQALVPCCDSLEAFPTHESITQEVQTAVRRAIDLIYHSEPTSRSSSSGGDTSLKSFAKINRVHAGLPKASSHDIEQLQPVQISYVRDQFARLREALEQELGARQISEAALRFEFNQKQCELRAEMEERFKALEAMLSPRHVPGDCANHLSVAAEAGTLSSTAEQFFQALQEERLERRSGFTDLTARLDALWKERSLQCVTTPQEIPEVEEFRRSLAQLSDLLVHVQTLAIDAKDNQRQIQVHGKQLQAMFESLGFAHTGLRRLTEEVNKDRAERLEADIQISADNCEAMRREICSRKDHDFKLQQAQQDIEAEVRALKEALDVIHGIVGFTAES